MVQPGRRVDLSPPSSVEVKNEWSCTSTTPSAHSSYGSRTEDYKASIRTINKLFTRNDAEGADDAQIEVARWCSAGGGGD